MLKGSVLQVFKIGFLLLLTIAHLIFFGVPAVTRFRWLREIKPKQAVYDKSPQQKNMYSNFLPNSVGVHIFQASILTLANLTNVVIKINLMLISEGPNLHLLKLFFASLILIVSILQRFLDSGVSIEQSVEPSTALRPPAVRINLIIWIGTPLVGGEL